MIDLHSHTKASDGEHSPADLVRRAFAAGVTVLAVTDHDTVAGLGEAEDAAEACGLALVRGIELSAFLERLELHILGHFVDPSNARLSGLGQALCDHRRGRMLKMIEKASALGVPVTLEEVESFSGGKNLGRPHLAQAMVARGHAANVSQAFERFIGVGRPAYVDRYRLGADEAIDLIRQAGGTATLAHPGLSKAEPDHVQWLKDRGLVGLEVAHSDHGEQERKRWRSVATKLDLVPTAGSDYHGEVVTPGRPLGTVTMEREALERLRNLAPLAPLP